MRYDPIGIFWVLDVQGKREAALHEFTKRGDSTVTRVDIPAEYHGYPVTRISMFAFEDCKFLREVCLPDSVKQIEDWAFENCPELREIRLPKHVEISPMAFENCPKLPPETILAAILESPEDITRPLDEDCYIERDGLLRPDVFALTIKYDSFRKIGTERLFAEIVRHMLFSHFETLEKAGYAPDVKQVDRLIRFSAEIGKTEMTAFLLDYKNRKFGFDFKDGGDNFEL